MNEDTIMFSIIAVGVVAWIAWAIIGTIVEARRKRELHRQIEVGEIPVDYSAAIREVATDQNNAILGTGFENEQRSVDLHNLRMKVSIIRVNGYDWARDDMDGGIELSLGILQNPYVKGSGSAKQWARGYCQASGTPPKEWMERA